MFSTLTTSAILQQTKGVTLSIMPPKKRVLENMPVDKTAASRSMSADDTALIQLYEQFRRPIHSYTYRLLGNQEDADDVTQEVFVRAFTSWDGLYERENLSAWLYRIATNLCVDMLRRRKRVSWQYFVHGQQEQQDNDQLDGAMFSALAQNGGISEVAERELIQHTLAALPPDSATVLVLSAAQGIPYQEIAQIIGISPNAAATRISRAKKQFMEQYQRLSKDRVATRRRRT